MASDLEETVVETAPFDVRNKLVFGCLIISIEDCDRDWVSNQSYFEAEYGPNRKSRGSVVLPNAPY